MSTSTAVTFTSPMPGLDPEVDFVLRGVEGAPGLYALEAVAKPVLRLFIADVAVYVPDYKPRIPAAARDNLDLSDDGFATIFVVINPASGHPTVNLQAPIILNPETGRCTQVVLDSKDYPLRAELQSG